MHYVVTAEIAHKPTEQVTDWLLDLLQDMHPVGHAHESGNAAVTVTLPAEGLAQAAGTVVRMIEPTHRVVSLDVIDEVARDRREGFVPVPELIGATEAAQALGISRAAVHKRIHAGALPAQRVGREWAIPASAVRT